jgi:hypothetical protein
MDDINLLNSPFGGEKNSRIGRFNGKCTVEAFTTDQWVTVQHVPQHYPQDARRIRGSWAGRRRQQNTATSLPRPASPQSRTPLSLLLETVPAPDRSPGRGG